MSPDQLVDDSAQSILDAIGKVSESDDIDDEIEEVEKVEDDDDDNDDDDNDDDGDKVEEEKVEDDDNDDDKDKDEDEEELEIEDKDEDDEPEDEDELELIAPVRKRQILEKYPKIFKDFPYLETAFYRDQKFVEIYPTIEDARVASEKAETLDKFESDLTSGTTEPVLKAIKEQNPEAFNKIVDNYIQTLGNIDQKAQLHVISNLSKQLIITIANAGKTRNDENLVNVAKVLNQFLFNQNEFESPTKLSKEEAEDKDKKQDEWLERRFLTVQKDVSTRIENALTATVSTNIDPRNSMTDYVKKQAVRDVMYQMQETISEDNRFIKILDRLWDKALDQEFSDESIRKIRSTYLSKAKTVLPTVIKKVRREAIRGLGKRTSEGRKKKSRGRTTTLTTPSGKEKDVSKMTAYEFLSQD